MKKQSFMFRSLFVALFTWTAVLQAQVAPKPSIAIIDFDTRGYTAANQSQCIQYIINELVRLGDFEVMDKYDIEYIAKRDTLKMTGCFSKICLAEFGKRLKVQKNHHGEHFSTGRQRECEHSFVGC